MKTKYYFLTTLCLLVGGTISSQNLWLDPWLTNFSHNFATNKIVLSTLRLKNLSNTNNAGSFQIQYWASTDNILDTNDFLINYSAFPGVPANTVYTFTVTLDLNNTIDAIPSGTYKLITYVDALEEVAESNENDNLYSWGSFSYASTAGVKELKNSISFFSEIFPNPTADVTSLKFSLSESENVTLKIYDSNGKQVMQDINQKCFDGNQTIDFKVNSLENGIYFYTLITDSKKTTGKFIVLK